MTEPIRDPDLDGFLALLAARRAATVDAYRRDLEHFGRWLDAPPSEATTEQLESYVAQLYAPTGSPATIGAEKASSLRALYRHLMLLGTRPDNPAAELASTPDPQAAAHVARRGRAPDRGREWDDAAHFATRRSSSCSTVRASASASSSRSRGAASTSTSGSSARSARGSKERVVPVGRRAVEALERYLSRGRPYLDTRHRGLFLNAKGGPLTRAGVFLIYAASRGKADSSRSGSTLTSCATRSRRISSKEAPTSEASEEMLGPRRPRDDRALHARIRFAPAGTAYFRAHPAREAAFQKLAKRQGRIGMNGISPQVLALFSTGVGVWMAVAGVQSALEWKQKRTCPSCGREIIGRSCGHHT